MIMYQSYLEDVKEHIAETPDNLFASIGKTKQEILQDANTMELLWMQYQKSIEEYNVDAEYAFRDALAETLHIPMDM